MLRYAARPFVFSSGLCQRATHSLLTLGSCGAYRMNAEKKLAPYRCYDPRDPDQQIDDPSTWQSTSNAVLIMASFLRAFEPSDDVCWDKVAALADMCDLADPPVKPPISRAETDAMLEATLAASRYRRR